MARETQTAMELRVGPLAEADLTVRRITGREALSRPYAFDVEFFPISGEPLDLAALGGAEALLTLRRPDGAERLVHGIAWAVELTGVERGAPRYRMRIAPRLARLGHVRRSRVFQALAVPDIVEKVLGDAGVASRASLSGSHPAREYCLQYRESDLEFVSRLLEDEGIFYWFEHAADGHTLVLADAAGGCANVAGDATVPFRAPQHGDAPEDEHVFRMAHAHRVRAGKVFLKDYDFERPELADTASAQAQGDALGLEQYLYPGGFRTPGAGSPIARARLEEQRVASDTFPGESTCLRFQPGAMFELAGHPDAGFERKLLLVSVVHEAAQQGSTGDAGGVQHGYANALLAVDAGRPYRPRRSTRKARAYAETATVVGPGGEEIHTDAHGRVKVQFHWDREGAGDDSASCFVRLAQSWAGASWGASFVPRIGQEVLVRFLEGDADAPLVVGAVYDGAHPPPIPLPAEKTRSTLRTDSSAGGGGSNELRLEDAKGAEEIYLHGQKDELVVVEHDKAQQVVHDETLEVAKDRNQQVSGNQALRVGVQDVTQVIENRSLTVLGSRTTSVVQRLQEDVKGSQAVTVARTEKLDVGAESATLVGAAAALSVGGVYAVTVGGVHNVAVVGARLEQVGGVRAIAVGASSEITVAKDASTKAGGDDAVTAGKGLTTFDEKGREESVGKQARTVVADQLVLLAKEFDLSGKTFTLNVGGKQILHAKSNGQIQLTGETITFSASGTAALKGSEVKKTAGSPASSASASREKVEEAKPASAQASLSKPTSPPLHADASGAVPADCEVNADVQVTNVPEGTEGEVAVHHCATGALVKGLRFKCKVQGGKLVDAGTGKPPVIKFDAAKMPWDPWDQPFFYLVASVKHGGLRVETPRDLKDGGKSLRVKYWSVAVADGWADTPAGGNLTTAAEAQEIAGILKSIPNSLAEPHVIQLPSPTLAQWGTHLANTYAYHHGSHGTAVDRTTGKGIGTRPPPKGFGNPPACPVGNWRSVVVLSHPVGNGMGYLRLGDVEVADAKAFPSVPRYLAYLDCCLAGWEPSLGRAFVARGTRHVIAFRMAIPDNDARAMARGFYKKWVQTHKLDPDKIRPTFFEAGAPYYGSMRPVLVGWKYEPILDPASSALEQAVEKVMQVIDGVVSAIGSLFK